MPAVESIIEGLLAQVFSTFFYHTVVVLVCIAFVLVVVYVGIRNIKGIVLKTAITTAVLGFIVFVIIVANIALEDTEDRGAKRFVVELTGFTKSILRMTERTLFSGNYMLHEL